MYKLYFYAWFPMTVIAIANGAAREFLYTDYLGELPAHQISTFLLIVLFSAYIYALMRIWFPESSAQALGIGGMWLTMTVAFEFGFGHYVAGHSWSQLFADYDVSAGRLWALIPLWVAFAPFVLFHLERRRMLSQKN